MDNVKTPNDKTHNSKMTPAAVGVPPVPELTAADLAQRDGTPVFVTFCKDRAPGWYLVDTRNLQLIGKSHTVSFTPQAVGKDFRIYPAPPTAAQDAAMTPGARFYEATFCRMGTIRLWAVNRDMAVAAANTASAEDVTWDEGIDVTDCREIEPDET